MREISSQVSGMITGWYLDGTYSVGLRSERQFLAHTLVLGFSIDQLSGGDVFQSDSHGLEQGQGLVRGAARHPAGYNVP